MSGDAYLKRRAAAASEISGSVFKACRNCFWFQHEGCQRADSDVRVDADHYCKVKDDAGQYAFAPTFQVLWYYALDRLAAQGGADE